MKNNPYIASSLDELLDEDDLLTTANEIAIKRVIAWQLQQEIEAKQMTKTALAKVKANLSIVSINYHKFGWTAGLPCGTPE